jgi:pentose-5-phosphate-3-epimerase
MQDFQSKMQDFIQEVNNYRYLIKNKVQKTDFSVDGGTKENERKSLFPNR